MRHELIDSLKIDSSAVTFTVTADKRANGGVNEILETGDAGGDVVTSGADVGAANVTKLACVVAGGNGSAMILNRVKCDAEIVA
jgi:hypothetical protein